MQSLPGPLQSVLNAVTARFTDIPLDPRPLLTRSDGTSPGQVYITVPPGRLLDVMFFLRDDPATRFNQLVDVTCVDHLHYPKPPSRERYGITYGLLSLALGHRLWVKCFVSDPDPQAPSVTSVWRGADWMEREVYDMFGIRFTGHPDLRRILTWEGFPAFPLRKDYPLRGRGERENYPVITRSSA
jgi:NADH-quinone oxidoreductase subunit C